MCELSMPSKKETVSLIKLLQIHFLKYYILKFCVKTKIKPSSLTSHTIFTWMKI